MNINTKQNEITKANARLIEAEAFFGGAQKIPVENALAQTRAEFEAEKTHAEKEAADEIKKLAGEIEINKLRRAEAESRWHFWNEQTNAVAPHFFKFAGFVVAGFLMLAGETALLQKIADVFGVAEPLYQFVLVGVIVLLLATLADSVVWFWRKNYNRFAVYTYGAIVLGGLVTLGIFRAFVLEIVEADGDAVLGRLYDETSILNKIVMVVLTAGLPIGATFAFEYGWYGLNRWKQWRNAKRDAVKYEKLHETFLKKHEAETEKLAKRLGELDELRDSWQSAQRQAHTEGARIGANRRPFWEILPLLIGVSLLILFVVMLVCYLFFDDSLAATINSDAGRFALYLLFSVGLILLFVYKILKRWNAPTPEQFYDSRTVRWQLPEVAPQTETILLPTAKTDSPVKRNGKFAESI
ncbi:hypothetical protein BH20ACI4_BH20ACI4_15550 [soil metagenome]